MVIIGLRRSLTLWGILVWSIQAFMPGLPNVMGADDPKNGKRIEIWGGNAPLGDGKFETAETWITVHLAEKPNGTAVVICPGGGYRGLVTGAEGHGIAKWLNDHGIAGIVLEYRLPSGRSFVPLLDVQRAIRTSRANADEWKIDPKRIGVMGFSAGGHLASTAATHFDEGDSKAVAAVDRVSCRPDFCDSGLSRRDDGRENPSGLKDDIARRRPFTEAGRSVFERKAGD